MRKAEIEIGRTYDAKVSGVVVPVYLVAEHSLGGYRARNTVTGREIRIKSAARLRRLAT